MDQTLLDAYRLLGTKMSVILQSEKFKYISQQNPDAATEFSEWMQSEYERVKPFVDDAFETNDKIKINVALRIVRSFTNNIDTKINKLYNAARAEQEKSISAAITGPGVG